MRCKPAGALTLLVVLIAAAPAAAETRTVSFDTLPPETTVADQFRDSDGVFFRGPDQGDSAFPITKALGPGLARSGSQVADISFCFGCEFYTPRSIGRLTRTARTVSAYVGYIGDPVGNPPADVTLIGRDAAGEQVGSATRTVVQGQPFNQPVTVTAPGPDIASFELAASPPDSSQPVGLDDLAITYPDAPAQPDFALGVSSAPANVPQGDSVDVPIDLNRLNGSNGDVTLTASGLPPGMTASFLPNPVPGADKDAVLRLTALTNAPPRTQYTEITITATPTSGAGPAPRSRTKLVRIVENCVRAFRTDYLDVRTAGCLRTVGPDILVATDEVVRINGLQLEPRAGLRGLIINKRKRTVTSDASAFSVALADRPAITLYVGTIDWGLGGSADGSKKVIDFSASAVKFFNGLKVEKVAVALTKAGKAQVSPTFKLDFWPFNYFGAVTATTAFATANDEGSDFNSLEVAVDKIAALGIELKDISVKWQEGTSWSGGATLSLRFAKAYSVGAGFGLKNGDFDFLRGSLGGINAAVSPGVFLQSIGFEVERNPFTLAGNVVFSAGPQVAGKKAVTVGGGFKAVLDDPFVIELNGRAKLVDRFDLGEAFLRYSSDGLFELGGKVEWDLKVAYANGQVSGFVDGLDAASLEGSVRGCIRIKWAPDPCAGAALIASNIGIAACVDVILGSAGVGYEWGGEFDLFWGDCDLGPWRPVRSGAGASAAAASNRFRLRPGLRSVAFAVEGAGASPGVTLVGPRGEQISVSQAVPSAQRGRMVAVQAGNDTTYVVVKRPSAGLWTLSDDGAVSVRRIRQAFGLPEPSAEARVSGSGASRTLSWRVRPMAGQRVRFVEMGRGVRNVITSTRAARGKTRFRPAVGDGRRRRIVAMVEQNGGPRATLRAGSYLAPGRPRPLRPRRLRLARRATGLAVSWTAPRPGFRHAVALRLADGRRLLRIVPAGARSARFRGVASGYAARAAVTGLTNANGRGPTATAASRGRPSARPAGGGWRVASTFDYVRRGSFSVARGGRSVSGLTLTPGRMADRTCGTRKLQVRGSQRLALGKEARLAVWTAGSRVTVVQGRKRRRAKLELSFDGARSVVGEVKAKRCRLYFEARRR
jgi:hypothetical protein